MTTQQTTQQQQIVALNRYARGDSYINESWASAGFKATFALAAKMAGFDDYTMGVSFSWSARCPESLSVTRDGIAVSKHEFKELPLEGELADTLYADLHRLAVVRMEADIRAERERALRVEAENRVSGLMQAVAFASVGEPR